MTCKTCKEPTASMPFVVHEAEMARAERCFKKLWAVIIILLFMLVATNIAWLWYESQFETIETTESYDLNADGNGNAIMNDEGSVTIGID